MLDIISDKFPCLAQIFAEIELLVHRARVLPTFRPVGSQDPSLLPRMKDKRVKVDFGVDEREVVPAVVRDPVVSEPADEDEGRLVGRAFDNARDFSVLES